MATQTFNYTGAVQTWVVPANTFSVEIECWGSPAWNKSGGYAKGTLAVTPGETLRIYVGGRYDGRLGGWNGGGNGGQSGGAYTSGYGGSGATDVRQGGTALSNRKIVAGGAGGRGAENTSGGGFELGGSGGAATGETGAGYASASGGGGGSQSAGGSGGGASAGGNTGSSGSLGSGGVGGYDEALGSIAAAGGGGGGGYYGGGGGGAYLNGSTNEGWGAGGGGGSNYVGGVTNGVSQRAVSSGVSDGLATLTWTPNTAPATPTTWVSEGTPTEEQWPTINAYGNGNGDGTGESYEWDVRVVRQDEGTGAFDVVNPVWTYTRIGLASPGSPAGPDSVRVGARLLPATYRAESRYGKRQADGTILWSSWDQNSDNIFTVVEPSAPPSIQLGDADAVYVGASPVNKIYHGSTQVWTP